VVGDRRSPRRDGERQHLPRRAGRDRGPAIACGLVVKRLEEEEGCAAILPRLLSASTPATARQQAEGKITKVSAEGERGFVVFHAPGAKLYRMTMVREAGEWKVATLASFVLVPEL
jgi:hypothetical protein